MIVEVGEDRVDVSGRLTSNRLAVVRHACQMMLETRPRVEVCVDGIEAITPEGLAMLRELESFAACHPGRIIVAPYPLIVRQAISASRPASSLETEVTDGEVVRLRASAGG